MGELAALLTAISWSFTSIFFNNASIAIGSVRVNRLRLLVATVILVFAHWVFLGSPLPNLATRNNGFGWGLSGIIGLALGDAVLFQAYVLLEQLNHLIMAWDPLFQHCSPGSRWVKLSLMKLLHYSYCLALLGVMEQRNGMETTPGRT